MTAPWHRARPTGAVDVSTDDDDFITVEQWPREVFRPHYHDAEFNWIVPMRAGRVVVAVDGDELAIDGSGWLCVFPRTPHAVVHVSDDCEVLSLFVPSAAMEGAWRALAPAPALVRPVIVGADPTIARGLALAWGEQRFSSRRADPTDDALARFLAGWLWRHYAAPADAGELTAALRTALADGPALVRYLDAHLAEQPFPWAGLAVVTGASSRTLQRRFVETLGLAPSVVLHRLRLDRARDLLRDPARPIGDVAAACGFASQAHFATAFRIAFDASPSEWRRRRARR